VRHERVKVIPICLLRSRQAELGLTGPRSYCAFGRQSVFNLGAPIPEQRQRVEAFGGVAVNACVTVSAGRLQHEQTLVNGMRVVGGAARLTLTHPTLDALDDTGLSVQHSVVHGLPTNKRLL
jgi:hypothetical protein